MGRPIANEIIKAIAEVEGIEPDHLDIVLESYVSTDGENGSGSFWKSFPVHAGRHAFA